MPEKPEVALAFTKRACPEEVWVIADLPAENARIC